MTLVNNEDFTDNSNEECNLNCPADLEENIIDDFGGLDNGDLDEEDTSLFIGKITKIFITKNKVEESINKNSDEIIVENNKSKKKKFPKKLKKKHAISLIDIFMSIFLIGPLTIGHWRGTWNLMDYYNFLSTGWICFSIGSSLHWMFAILRNVLHRKLVEKWKFKSSFGRAAYGLLRLMYTYIFCLVCNMQWRGGWLTLDSLIGIQNTWIIGSVTFMCIVFLLILRSSRNLIAPPFIIVIDIPNLTFKFPTRFGSQV
ncbi:uncharacterized protein LOC122861235 [Aphidius gifuensis]|nr:uncharacterized protein LOC122861235 [Aphidius gifuensis]